MGTALSAHYVTGSIMRLAHLPSYSLLQHYHYLFVTNRTSVLAIIRFIHKAGDIVVMEADFEPKQPISKSQGYQCTTSYMILNVRPPKTAPCTCACRSKKQGRKRGFQETSLLLTLLRDTTLFIIIVVYFHAEKAQKAVFFLVPIITLIVAKQHGHIMTTVLNSQISFCFQDSPSQSGKHHVAAITNLRSYFPSLRLSGRNVILIISGPTIKIQIFPVLSCIDNS